MKQGIHTLSMAEYLNLRALSSGLCHTLLTQSAWHAKFEQDGPRDDGSEASDIGTAIHSALLEGLDNIAVIEAKDWRTNAAKDAREAARAEGKVPMLAHKVAQVTDAVKAVHAFIATSELKGVFDSGKPEQVLIWNEGKVLCKARPDWLAADQSVLLHVKTTAGSAQPESWIRNQLSPMGYDVALAFYERGLYAATDGNGKGAPLSVFLVIEQNAPHGCSLVSLDPAYMTMAANKVQRAIELWAKCQTSGKYPAYPSQIAYATPKPWDLQAEEEHGLTGAYDALQEKEGMQI